MWTHNQWSDQAVPHTVDGSVVGWAMPGARWGSNRSAKTGNLPLPLLKNLPAAANSAWGRISPFHWYPLSLSLTKATAAVSFSRKRFEAAPWQSVPKCEIAPWWGMTSWRVPPTAYRSLLTPMVPNQDHVVP